MLEMSGRKRKLDRRQVDIQVKQTPPPPAQGVFTTSGTEYPEQWSRICGLLEAML